MSQEGEMETELVSSLAAEVEDSVENPIGERGRVEQSTKADERSHLLQSSKVKEVKKSPLLEQAPVLVEKKKREEEEKKKNFTLYLVFFAFVLTSLGNRLFQKLQTYPMYNYPLVVNLLSTMIYVPVCFAYVIPAIWCMDPSPITKEQQSIPKTTFAVMGALDCISSLMQVLAVNFIPNASTLVLLQQSAIPISMVVSRLSFSHVRYDYWQIGGAAVVLGGIATVLAPQILASHSSSHDDDYSDDDASSNVPQWLWPLMIILSCIPMCVGSVFKEKSLGEHDIDVVYLNGWIAVFQTFMSLPLAIPTAFATELPLEQIPINIYDGMRCFIGINSIGAGISAEEWAANGDRRPADNCATAPYFVSAFLVFNLTYNVLIILILKLGSSSLLYLGSTVLVPISNGMFSLPIIPGHKPLHLADLLGLFIIMSGLTLYRVGSVLWAYIVKSESIASLLRTLLFEDDEDEDDDDDNGSSEDEEHASGLPPRYPRRRSQTANQESPALPEPPSPLLRESLLASAEARRRYRQHRPFDGRRSRPRPRTKAAITRYFGPNQMEMLQPMLQAQKSQIKHSRARSNAQIRQNFLLKLGFSPDPANLTDRSPARLQHTSHISSPQINRSPGDIRRMRLQQQLAIGGVNAVQDPSFRRLIDKGRSSSFDTRLNTPRRGIDAISSPRPPRHP